MMRKSDGRARGAKIAIVGFLLALSCGLTYYFHVRRHTAVVFTHFFYAPIILACVWWRRRGLVVAVFLAAFLLVSDYVWAPAGLALNDYVRAAMFVAIGFVAVVLSERIARRERALLEATEKTEHLNAVLRGICNVNQLVVSDKDPDRLLERVCGSLVEARGYHNAWIARFDEGGKVVKTVEAGLGGSFSPMADRLMAGQLAACVRRALDESGVVVTEDPHSACTDCPLAARYAGRAAMTTALRHDGKTYGLLCVSIPRQFLAESDEKAFFREVAGDIAFALYAAEQEQQRRQAEREIQDLAKFPSENPNPVLRISAEGGVLYRNEAAAALLEAWGCREGEPLTGRWGEVVADTLASAQGRQEELEHHGCVFSLMFAPVAEGDYVNVYGHDITERKRAEEALRASRDYLDRILNGMFEGVVVVDPNYIVRDVNACFLRQHEVSRDQVIGRRCYEVIHQADDPCPVGGQDCPAKQVFASGKPSRAEHVHVTGGGERRVVEINAFPVLNPDGAVEYAVELLHDITDRKRAEEEVREERDFAEALVETAQTAVLVLDPEGRIVRFNPYLEEISGYRLEEVQGKDWFSSFLPQRDRERMRELFLQAVDDIQTRGNVNPIITKDGREREIEWYDKTLKDAEGDTIGLLSIGQDVTERKRAEEALRERERFLRDVIDALQDGLSVLDRDLNIVRVNRWMEKMYAHEKPLEGKKCYAAYQQRDTVCPWCPTVKAMETGETQRTEVPYPSAEDAKGWIDLSAFPLRDERGDITGAIEYVKDITERKRAEEALRQAHDELEERVHVRTAELRESNEELDAFARSVSHDLKAPLRAIEGFSDALEEDYGSELDETGRDYLEQISGCAIRMGQLITDLLSHARLGRDILTFGPVDLGEVIDRARDTLRSEIKASGAAIHIEGALPTVEGHRGTLELLFQDLLENAIKFVEPGASPEVVVGAVDEEMSWRISVRDNGIGVEEQFHESIFGIFQRLHTTAAYPGTGIGLAIARKGALLHGGNVWVESKPGEGSTFYVTLQKHLAGPGGDES